MLKSLLTPSAMQRITPDMLSYRRYLWKLGAGFELGRVKRNGVTSL
jgi:hypothetical protein